MFLYTSIELVSYFGKVQRGMALVKASLGYFTAPKAEGAEFSSPFGAKDRPESVLAPLTHGADGLAHQFGLGFSVAMECAKPDLGVPEQGDYFGAQIVPPPGGCLFGIQKIFDFLGPNSVD